MNDAWRLVFTENANACLLWVPVVLYFDGNKISEVIRDSTLFGGWTFCCILIKILGRADLVVWSTRQLNLGGPKRVDEKKASKC